jgi:hypothetical protein
MLFCEYPSFFYLNNLSNCNGTKRNYVDLEVLLQAILGLHLRIIKLYVSFIQKPFIIAIINIIIILVAWSIIRLFNDALSNYEII